MRIMINPTTRRQMAGLGEDVYRASTKGGEPISSLMHMLSPRYQQIANVRSQRDLMANLLRSAHPSERPALQAKFRQELQDLFAEVGTAAAPRIRMQQQAGPVAAGVGLAGVGGLAAGNITGRNQEHQEIQDDVENMPLYRRIQYSLFPKTLVREPKPLYERFVS